MFSNSHQTRDNYGSTDGTGTAPGNGHDENAELQRKDLKGLASLASNARRNILGDKSNVALEASRNLRTSTLQSTMTSRSRLPARSGPSAELVERPCNVSEDARALAAAEKENRVPAVNQSIKAPTQPITRDWDDLDAEDAEDPLMVSEYVNEIFAYMRQLELNIVAPADYMETQKELNWHSRSVLIDWLIEVQWKLKLLPETLFLSVNIIDRFLSKRSVSLVKLQLVGMAATLLASKYEEVLSPSIANFVYLSDNAYDEQELLKAERYMLHVLNFSLAYPSPLVFLRRISKAEDYDVRSRTLAKYLMEVCLLDSNFVSCPPSMMSAVSIYLAREMLKSGPWTPNLRHYSGEYTEADIKPWTEKLLDYLKKPVTYEAVFKKYALKKLMKASLFVSEYMKRMYNVPPHTIRDNGKSVFTA